MLPKTGPPTPESLLVTTKLPWNLKTEAPALLLQLRTASLTRSALPSLKRPRRDKTTVLQCKTRTVPHSRTAMDHHRPQLRTATDPHRLQLSRTAMVLHKLLSKRATDPHRHLFSPDPFQFRCRSTSTHPQSLFHKDQTPTTVLPSHPTGQDHHQRLQTVHHTGHHLHQGGHHPRSHLTRSLPHQRGHPHHPSLNTSQRQNPSRNTSHDQLHLSHNTSQGPSLNTSQDHSHQRPGHNTSQDQLHPSHNTSQLHPSNHLTSQLPQLPHNHLTEEAMTIHGQRLNQTCPRSPTWTSLARRTS